jgi:hypothetical protein
VGRASCRAAMTGGCLSARRRAAFGRGRLQRDRTHDSVAHGPRNPHHLHTDLTTGYGCVVVDALPASEVGVAAIVRPALDDRPCAHALAVADIRRLPEPQLDLPATCVGEVRAAVGCASRSKRLDEPHALRKPSRHVICHDVRKRGCRDRAGTRKAKRTGTRGPERLRRWRKDPAGDWRRGVVRAGSTHDGHHKCQWNESSSKHRHVIMPLDSDRLVARPRVRFASEDEAKTALAPLLRSWGYAPTLRIASGSGSNPKAPTCWIVGPRPVRLTCTSTRPSTVTLLMKSLSGSGMAHFPNPQACC